MTTVTFNIPNWADPVGASERTWALVISILATALVASIILEVVKRKYSKAQVKKGLDEVTPMAKHYVALILTALTSLFTAASYFIVFAQTNASTLSVVPYLGTHVPQAIGVAYLLYNLRLNKTYQNVATQLGKWSKSSKPAAASVLDTTESGQPTDVSDSLLS